jgi:hypothetical protein
MRQLNVLVACEFSGIVREAFQEQGHHAVSCDFLEPLSGGPHFQGDILTIMDYKIWDIMIAFPPCTYLAHSGMQWTYAGFRPLELTEEALDFVRILMSAPIDKIAIENPIGVISKRIKKHDCIVQPWEHGHYEQKSTCLWLKNLPILKPSKILKRKAGRLYDNMTFTDNLKLKNPLLRSITYPGIAMAMARQWSHYVPPEDRIKYEDSVVHNTLKNIKIGRYIC